MLNAEGSIGMARRDKGKKMKILVVAPEFPLVNQPWMDTYLEHLLINEIDFRVFSLNQKPTVYGEKVDRLDLLKKTSSYDFSRWAIISSIVKAIPILSGYKSSFRIRHSGILKTLGFSKLVTYVMHFHSIIDSFDDIDLIHSHSESMSYRFIVLAELLNVPLIMTFHGLPPKGVLQLSQNKRKELYDYARIVIVNTKFAKRQVEQFGCASEKIVVLPQGLPIEDFPYRPKPALRKGEVLQLLSVGRFHRDKGQHYSLLALKRLLADGIQAHWTFVGTGPNLGWLKQLTKKYGMQNNVTFKTEVPSKEIVELYHQTNLFILASIDTPGGHVETQGVVLQEAQASGCIPITTRTGGIVECVHHQQDAVLIRPQSSRAIYDAITSFIEKPELWSCFQKNGRLNVEKNFSADVIGERMAILINNYKRQES
jgi:glycosyltransferase involved in cell wall biosynthesis